MNEDVVQAWDRITGWLRTHAPVSYAGIRPPVDPAALDAAGAESGVRLPPALATLLTRCDGTVEPSAPDRDPDEYDPGLFLAQRHLLPLEAIAVVRGSGRQAEGYWGPWVPFAVADYSLAPWDGLAVDADGRLAVFGQGGGEPPCGRSPPRGTDPSPSSCTRWPKPSSGAPAR
ncbi:hypothetical protein GCM10010145_42270 [Streptomyces ruber]|uniref:Knr4/Smi1-like domain-containing protein n=2 Tax=Streptomyces TaxID=1883 RepID=A0A918BHK3_9ACTN|nr:hypothetical protein [Streptomyces ruber]GGQ67935.1 hypothetical protein GCM10010145_42270 [Streptomyces ruber]